LHRANTNSTFPGNFKQIEDQSEISLLQIDNSLAALRLASYGTYTHAFQAYLTAPDSLMSSTTPFSTAVDLNRKRISDGNKLLNDYYGFRLSLENLRAYSYRHVFQYYQNLLLRAKQGEEFSLSDTDKPLVVQAVADMAKSLGATQDTADWNTKSATVIDKFLETADAQKLKLGGGAQQVERSDQFTASGAGVRRGSLQTATIPTTRRI
jgi:hypothetical protein